MHPTHGNTDRQADPRADSARHARDRLLQQIDAATRRLADPNDVMAVVARLLGEALAVSRCAYADVETDADEFTIRHDYTDGCASTVGRYRLTAFGRRATELLSDGRTLIVRDVDAELADDDGGATFRSIGIAAVICAGLVREGGLRAMMAVHQVEPRDWTPSEVALVEAVVSQCWTTIEQIRDRIRLERSERFHRSTLDAVSSRIAVLDHRGRILRTNAAWDRFGERRAGVWSRMVEGANYPALCDELAERPGAERLATAVRAVLEGSRERADLDYSFPCGTKRCWFRCGLRRFEADGHVRVAVSHEDVTDSKRAQSHAERAHRRFARLFDHAPDAVLVTDDEGRITLANRRCAEIFGYSRDELQGLSVDELVPDAQRGRHAELRAAYTSAPTPRAMSADCSRLEGRRKDGTEFPVEISLSPLPDDDGVAVLGAVRDVGERVARESRERQAQRLASIGTLAGGIAHDLNNALVPVILGVELVRARVPDAGPMLDKVQEGAERAAAMVRQLLTFARGSESEPIPVDPVVVVREVERILRGTFPKDVTIAVRLDDELPAILGDGTQLHQVLLNLCLNARDAMPEGGRLSIVAELRAGRPGSATDAPHVVLRVTDTGHGIDPEHREQIFDPFFTTKGPEEGTGLGLAMASTIVRNHGGTIEVESGPEGGTTFSVWLPATDGTAEPDAAETDPEVFDVSGLTILVVDDERQVREVIADGLRGLGCNVVTAGDGRLGLQLAQELAAELDVVVTDLHMPRLDGLGLVRALRDRGSKLPVVVASGRLEPADAARLAELGIQERLPKPYTRARLVRALSRLLSH